MKIDQKKLDSLNKKIYQNGAVDREHLLEFLESLPSNDGVQIVAAVKEWLETLEKDPKYSKIAFPRNDITAILSDLDSYGRVQAETIMQFKQEAPKTVPIS